MLRVLQVPRMMSSLPKEMTRRSGETGVSVTCKARGKPAPSVVWLFNKKVIDDKKEYLYTVNTSTLDNRNEQSVIVTSTLYFR